MGQRDAPRTLPHQLESTMAAAAEGRGGAMSKALLLGGPLNGSKIDATALGGRFTREVAVPVADHAVVYELAAGDGPPYYRFKGWQEHLRENRLTSRG